MSYSADLADSFFDALVEQSAGIADPLHLAQVWISESNLKADAVCMIHGLPFAGGIFQAVNSTLRGLGYTDGVAAFARLIADDQLPWAMKYYAPFKGRLVNPTACYLANFLPALLSQAQNPGYPIASANGQGISWTNAARAAVIYSQNAGLDRDHDGILEVHDLTVRLQQANVTPRAHEVADRINAAKARAGTQGPRSSAPPPPPEAA